MPPSYLNLQAGLRMLASSAVSQVNAETSLSGRAYDPVLVAEEQKSLKAMQKRQQRSFHRAALHNLGGKWACQAKLFKCDKLISANQDLCRRCMEAMKAMTSPEILQQQFEAWKATRPWAGADEPGSGEPAAVYMTGAETFLDFLIAQSRKAVETVAKAEQSA